jgi:hypothetical protein
VNNCDREKIGGKLERIHFQIQRKQCFGISKFPKILDLFLNNVKENSSRLYMSSWEQVVQTIVENTDAEKMSMAVNQMPIQQQ